MQLLGIIRTRRVKWCAIRHHLRSLVHTSARQETLTGPCVLLWQIWCIDALRCKIIKSLVCYINEKVGILMVVFQQGVIKDNCGVKNKNERLLLLKRFSLFHLICNYFRSANCELNCTNRQRRCITPALSTVIFAGVYTSAVAESR